MSDNDSHHCVVGGIVSVPDVDACVHYWATYVHPFFDKIGFVV